MKQKFRVYRIAAILLLLLSIGAVAGMALAVHYSGSFTPPAFEAAAQTGQPGLTESDGYSTIDAKEYQVALCGQPQITKDGLALSLTNPEGNGVWLKVRVYDEQGALLGESGILKEGEYVKEVLLSDAGNPSEESAISLKIMAYEPDTYYSAGVVTLNTVTGGRQEN